MAVVAFPDPQLAPVGVTLVGLVGPVEAVLAALDSQQAPAGVALACCLKHRLQHKLKYSQEHW